MTPPATWDAEPALVVPKVWRAVLLRICAQDHGRTYCGEHNAQSDQPHTPSSERARARRGPRGEGGRRARLRREGREYRYDVLVSGGASDLECAPA